MHRLRSRGTAAALFLTLLASAAPVAAANDTNAFDSMDDAYKYCDAAHSTLVRKDAIWTSQHYGKPAYDTYYVPAGMPGFTGNANAPGGSEITGPYYCETHARALGWKDRYDRTLPAYRGGPVAVVATPAPVSATLVRITSNVVPSGASMAGIVFVAKTAAYVFSPQGLSAAPAMSGANVAGVTLDGATFAASGLALTPNGLSATGGLHFTAPNGEAVTAAGLGSLVASGPFAGSGPYTASAVTFSGTNVIGKSADAIVALLGPSGPTMLAALGSSGLADVLAGLTIPQGYSVQSVGEPKRYATAGEAEAAGKCGPSDVVFVMPGNRYGTKAAQANRLGYACKATIPKGWTAG